MIVFLFTILVFLSYCVLKCGQFFFKQYRLYYALKDIPGPEIRKPLFGNLRLLLDLVRYNEKSNLSKEFIKLLTDLSDKYGRDSHGIVRLWLGPFAPLLIVSDAKVAQEILASPHFLDKSTFYSIFRFALDDGIFTCNGFKWKNYKRELQVHFKLRALESYIPRAQRHLEVLNEHVDKIIQSSDGFMDNVKPIISTFVLDTLGENIFSTEFNSQSTGEPKFVKQIHEMLEISYKSFLRPWTYFFSNIVLRYLVSITSIKEIGFLVLSFRKSIHRIVIGRYKTMLKEKEKIGKNYSRVSLLDSMIESRLDKTKKIQQLNEIERQINVFVVAGHDTTTSSVSWTLYLLGHHPEVQQRLQQEIDWFYEELRANNETLNLFSLKKLKYLNCCIQESLRLYPSGPFIGRKGRKSLVVNDQITIPAGVNVIIFIQHMHLQQKYFKDPHKFYPERFLMPSNNDNENNSAWVTHAAYMPFSSGIRVCIGKEYGLVQQKIFFLNLLSKYTVVSLDEYGSCKPSYNFLLSHANFPVQFKRREL